MMFPHIHLENSLFDAACSKEPSVLGLRCLSFLLFKTKLGPCQGFIGKETVRREVLQPRFFD